MNDGGVKAEQGGSAQGRSQSTACGHHTVPGGNAAPPEPVRDTTSWPKLVNWRVNGPVLTFQKPCTADSRSLWNNQLKAKLLRPFGQRSDLLLAIPGFVVFGSFIDVRLSVFDEPVEQAG